MPRTPIGSGYARRPVLKTAKQQGIVAPLIPVEITVTAPPTRDKLTGRFKFKGFPIFRPNLSPSEVFQKGAFGGAYFGNIHSSVTGQVYTNMYKEFPKEWFKDIKIKEKVASNTYDPSRNCYGVKSGNDLEFWEGKGWIKEQDPYGWFQWYCRFFLGRRSPDDDRQISRWNKCCGAKGRWKNFLIAKIVQQGKAFNDYSASPVTRQTLLHWAYDLSEKDFDAYAKRVRAGKSTCYIPAHTMAHVQGNNASQVKKEEDKWEAAAREEEKLREAKKAAGPQRDANVAGGRYSLRGMKRVKTEPSVKDEETSEPRSKRRRKK